MENEKIIALMEGYGAGTLTREEEIAFFQWYGEAGAGEFHELLSQCKGLSGHLSYYPEIPADLKARLEQGLQDDLSRIPYMRRSRWGWAAAAILIMLGAGGYFLFINKSENQMVSTQPVRNDAVPGKTRAVLTLADGNKITLDS